MLAAKLVYLMTAASAWLGRVRWEGNAVGCGRRKVEGGYCNNVGHGRKLACTVCVTTSSADHHIPRACFEAYVYFEVFILRSTHTMKIYMDTIMVQV